MSTRQITHDDGRLELIALPNTTPAKGYYASEKSIVWLQDVSELPWIRERKATGCRHRKGRIGAIEDGEMLGYAKLHRKATADPETGLYVRRIFFLWNDDRTAIEQGEPPTANGKLIAPTTVAPRVRSSRLKPDQLGSTRSDTRLPKSQPPTDIDDDDVMQWIDEADDVGSVAKAASTEPLPETLASSGEMLGSLISLDGGPAVALHKRSLVVGRLDECDIRLPYPNVSAVHCKLFVDDGYWFVQDQNSTNGVKVNGIPVPADSQKRVDPRAVLSIGKMQYEMHYSPEDLGAVGPPPADVNSASMMAQSLLERAGSQWPKQKH